MSKLPEIFHRLIEPGHCIDSYSISSITYFPCRRLGTVSVNNVSCHPAGPAELLAALVKRLPRLQLLSLLRTELRSDQAEQLVRAVATRGRRRGGGYQLRDLALTSLDNLY